VKTTVVECHEGSGSALDYEGATGRVVGCQEASERVLGLQELQE
jgi:hypothetical protein